MLLENPDLFAALCTMWGYGMGVLLGYIIWAPSTPFKKGMISVFSFGIIKP